MLRLSSGVTVDGDREIVFRAVELQQAAGDGLYAADVIEATELPAEAVQVALASLVDDEVLATTGHDAELGMRFVMSRAV